jgi:uncharacterized membrane protein YGL010W
MKDISASIVALAGAIMVTAGLSVGSDRHTILFFIGCGVGIVGLVGWVFQFVSKN